MDPFADIEKFYRDVVGLPIPTEPTRLKPERKAAAVEHWREETQEFLDAKTLEDEIDACLDLAWLAIGRGIEMGALAHDHCAEVVRANMERVRGQSAKRPLSGGFDAVKPEGWEGPDHGDVLRRFWHTDPQERKSPGQRADEFIGWILSDEPAGNYYALDRGHGLERTRHVVE